MKKITLTIFIALFILLVNYGVSSAQTDRTPIYVHGLGDDRDQWAAWQTLFRTERRMIEGSNGDYISAGGVADFASRIPIPVNNNTIYFGHSTGGVVARHIVQHPTPAQSNQFGGIITAGAPMDGARISNNLANNTAGNFVVNGVDKVLKGPIRELGLAAGLLYEVASHRFKDMAEREVNTILNALMGGATATDLAEGSAYMNNGDRTATSTLPKIHIYGNESSPVLWRIASVAAGWGDGELASATQQAYEVCRTLKQANIAKAFLNPFGAALYRWRADGWDTSANWLKDGSERGWNDLIGASIPASITTSSQVLDYTGFGQCMSQYNGTQATYAQYLQCQQQNTHTVFYTTYSPVNTLSDGFIKAPSQTGYHSPWSNNATRIEALGVNHLEMREHAEMIRVYNGVFDRTIFGVDQFFFTPRR